MILDLFAGPGGWSEGLRMLGLSDVGIEWDDAACRTRAAAGHLTIRADVSQYPPQVFAGKVAGLIASPPCQDFSLAGKQAGRTGDKGQFIDTVPDWVEALRPRWVACEQVPPALEVWEEFAYLFRSWGYSTWAGVLNAADYGVPQTRRRAFLLASLDGPALPPEPTHAKSPEPGLFGTQEPWVSMAEALGWSETVEVVGRRGAGMTERHGEREATPTTEPYPTVTTGAHRRHWVVDRRTNSRGAGGAQVPTVTVPVSEPAPTFTGKSGHQWVLRNGAQANATVRPADEPALTILASADNGDTRWCFDRSRTTIVGSFSPDTVAAPGYRKAGDPPRQDTPGSIKITLSEALTLQSFPADYPVQGSKTKQYEQVGNACPPLLSAHVIAALLGQPMQEAVA